ncbi:hypothetical protein O0L34_g13539 [Tuta absoluta]|nr:hypothetical protein O0L34_g13539 [Tuta absoluta]
MPKKQPRNAFYFYMLYFKEEQRKKGIHYANMREVSEAAGPRWPEASPALRAKFEAMAKTEKEKSNVPERKYTSYGVSLADIEAEQREARAAAEAERRDIINFVKQKSVNQSILDEDIFLMDVNSYCKANGTYLVGELTLLRFTLRHGVKDSYHELINPGGIPIGYALDVKLGAKELGLPMPGDAQRGTDYIQILANVVDYLRRRDHATTTQTRRSPLPAVYTMPDKVQQCVDFTAQLCHRAAQYDTPFRVYQLDTLFFQLVDNIPSRSDEGFPKESLALPQLKKDPFKYSPGLACEHHEGDTESDKSVECTSSRVTRWAFTILDMTCLLLNLRAQPGRHVPNDYAVDDIIAYKEQSLSAQRQGRGGMGGAGGGDHFAPDDTPTSCRSADTSADITASGTSRDTSFASSASAPGASAPGAPPGAPRDKKRVHVPLRMPKNSWTSVRAAPDLTADKDDFPPLPSRGRGRGLAASFDNMKM